MAVLVSNMNEWQFKKPPTRKLLRGRFCLLSLYIKLLFNAVNDRNSPKFFLKGNPKSGFNYIKYF